MLNANYKNETIAFCEKFSVKSLYVFGSVLTETFDEDSDIDFLISFSDSLSSEEYTENYFNLRTEFEKLLSRKVDLTTEKSLQNPYFIQSINESKQLLYNAA